MPKRFAIAVSAKAALVAASFALARGEMLPAILISILFNLAQFGAKPVDQTVPQETIVAERSPQSLISNELSGGDSEACGDSHCRKRHDDNGRFDEIV
jgi:hypothetical protein